MTYVANATIDSSFDGTYWPKEVAKTLGPGPIGVYLCVPNEDGSKPASCDGLPVPTPEAIPTAIGVPTAPNTIPSSSAPQENVISGTDKTVARKFAYFVIAVFLYFV